MSPTWFAPLFGILLLFGMTETIRAASPRWVEAEAPRSASASSRLQSAEVSRDTVNALFWAGRSALNRREPERAAHLFGAIRQDFPDSPVTADALYWEALARERIGGDSQLRLALEVLEIQALRFPTARTRPHAQALIQRIRGRLAGDSDPVVQEILLSEARERLAACDPDQLAALNAALASVLPFEADGGVAVLADVLRRRESCPAALREQAVFHLSSLPSAAAHPIAFAAAKQERHPVVLDRLVQVLTLGAPPAMLRDLYSHLPTPIFKERVIEAVARGDDEEALDWLESVFLNREEHSVLRWTALERLAEAPSASSARLQRIARSAEPVLRDRLIEILRKRGERAPRDTVGSAPDPP